jgi:putative hydrolase of the HAD superfamily
MTGNLKKPLKQYKMIYFDVGDTLITIPEARIIMYQYLAARSFIRDENEIDRLFTEAFRLFYYGRQIEKAGTCTPESDRAFWMKLYDYILRHLGAHEEWTEDEIHQCCHELYDLFSSPECYQLFDDVKECLPKIRQLGLRMGIVSNFAPTLKGILEDKGILSYFDPVIVSTEVGLEKPDPAIFELALERSGLEAKDILYIGDHDRNDIWAPNQVGIDAVKIKRYDFHTGEGIRSLRELLA